jgi:hypothetical protein
VNRHRVGDRPADHFLGRNPGVAQIRYPDPKTSPLHEIGASPIGECHRAGCDIGRCYHCGWQALGCLHFDPDDARRQAWNGKWPGEEDCERSGFFVNGDPDFPDLNRLFTDCVWDADVQRRERKQ